MVLPVGCDLAHLDQYAPGAQRAGQTGKGPLILWNQRWEYDKDPETLLWSLATLAEEGLDFRVALAGENFRVQPAEFEAARSRLGDRLIHFGFVEGAEAYGRLLWEADIVVSTASHEFFGVGVVEALYCGCIPVLPDRLSYPELIPPASRAAYLYRDRADLLCHLRAAISAAPADRSDPCLREWVRRFDWSAQAPLYDAMLAEVVSRAVRSPTRDTGSGAT